ncbi:MAG: CopD family protein [Alphaproteobacteria bacterium]
MSIAIAIHIMAAMIWVGGMFFAVYVQRPASGPLEPPDRLALWGRALGRFLPWVWAMIAVLLGSGYWMVFAAFGGLGDLPLYLNLMHGIGWLMVLVFLHLWFAPYRRFRKALAAGEFPEAAGNLDMIRKLVTINLYLGLINGAIGASGPYWP